MGKRKQLGKRARFELFKRDQFTCQYCGRTPPAVVLVLDHIVPVAENGETTPENLITACEDCNSGKGAVPLTSVGKPVLDVVLLRRERQEQLAAYNEHLLAIRKADRDLQTRLSHSWEDFILSVSGEDWVLSADERQSLKVFSERLPECEICDAMEIAVGRKYGECGRSALWKYFCGVCWKKIRTIEEGNCATV